MVLRPHPLRLLDTPGASCGQWPTVPCCWYRSRYGNWCHRHYPVDCLASGRGFPRSAREYAFQADPAWIEGDFDNPGVVTLSVRFPFLKRFLMSQDFLIVARNVAIGVAGLHRAHRVVHPSAFLRPRSSPCQNDALLAACAVQVSQQKIMKSRIRNLVIAAISKKMALHEQRQTSSEGNGLSMNYFFMSPLLISSFSIMASFFIGSFLHLRFLHIVLLHVGLPIVSILPAAMGSFFMSSAATTKLLEKACRWQEALRWFCMMNSFENR